MDVRHLTTDEIREELARREQEEAEGDKPKMLEKKIDLVRLKGVCQAHIDALANGEYESDDTEHYIYEEAMNALFGKGVWKWINKHM